MPTSSAWRVAIAALLGAVFGTTIGATWRALNEQDRPAEDSIGLLYLTLVVGLPTIVVVSWVLLALTGPAWVAPTVTIGGLATGGFALGLYQQTIDPSGLPPVAVYASIWGTCYAAVALACVPRVLRPVRVGIIALLVTPAILSLVL
ncbi:hypothetical protein ABT008_20530 [Micromonospora sp. NPDC002389]|uniref:hypothetical protein n=1 Tax=Micromonospora sp. NPDC002389 TaxID=3154272 RepID=UPI00332ECF2A